LIEFNSSGFKGLKIIGSPEIVEGPYGQVDGDRLLLEIRLAGEVNWNWKANWRT
jgi:hypothetical protein